MKPLVTIYTDGSCLGNPGVGGWSAILVSGAHTKTITGSDPATTNNRMELTAVAEALKALKQPSDVILFSDSTYVTGCLTCKAKKNLDLITAIRQAAITHHIEFRHVPGHSGDPFNEQCDRLAQTIARKEQHQ